MPWRKHKHDINIFWGKKIFFEKKKQKQSLFCLKNCEMNNFLAILELCAFYIEYKKVNFTTINFRGRTNVKYFMQAQILRFCKDTAKVSYLPLLKKLLNQHILFLQRRRNQYCGLNFKQMKYKRSQNLTSKYRAVKNL